MRHVMPSKSAGGGAYVGTTPKTSRNVCCSCGNAVLQLLRSQGSTTWHGNLANLGDGPLVLDDVLRLSAQRVVAFGRHV